MVGLLESRKTFRELGIVRVRAVKISGRSFFEYTVWFEDGSVLKDISIIA